MFPVFHRIGGSVADVDKKADLDTDEFENFGHGHRFLQTSDQGVRVTLIEIMYNFNIILHRI